MAIELEQTDRLRRDLIANVSHELRTPLASLRGTLELLEEELRDGAAGADAVRRADTALRQTHRLTALATDLLDLSRVDSAAPLRIEPVELGELAGMVAGEVGARLQADGRPLELEGGPALALGDAAAVARILRILLDNARGHGAGAVTVTVRAGDGRAEVAVADMGPGVAPDETERIFRRFARGRAAARTPGAGLGLAIARGLARGMGGTLVSEPAPRGARFVLALRPAPAGEIGELGDRSTLTGGGVRPGHRLRGHGP
jgi:signal transduction histidine kinase